MSTIPSTSIHPIGTVGFFRVTGRDARDYLNRRLSQKTIDIAAGNGRRAFLLDAVGKMLLDLEVYAHGEGLLLLAPRQDREEVIAHLEKYVFTEDCVFEDLSHRYSAFAVLGPRRDELVALLDVPVPAVHKVTSTAEAFAFGSDYALGETLLLVPSSDVDAWLARLKEAAVTCNASFPDPDQFNALRIVRGVPAWQVDITTDDMPLDAPSLRHGIHFDKGCYPGQEALARVENLGHPARCLVLLESQVRTSDMGLVLTDSETGAEVGRLTSASFNTNDGNVVGLAMVKWSVREAGRRFACGDVLFESLGPVAATEALGR